MLPFFARTLTRREMALGCAVLSLALLLSALPAALRWGQAQLDTGALLCADTGADGPGRAGKAGDLFHRYGTAGGNVL